MKRWFDGENACRNSTCRVPFSIECWLEKHDGGPFVPVKNEGNERQIYHVTIPLIVAR